MSASNGSPMTVAVYYNNQDIRIEKRPVPKIGPGELLVKVMASGICGSDVMEWYRIKSAPRVLGHEISGIVQTVATNEPRFKEGDRVFVTHHVPCNTCHYCLKGLHTACPTLHRTNFDPGGFSQYLRVPAINVDRGTWTLPPSVTFEEATFIEPLACVVRGFRLAQFKPAQTVLVLGSGIAGILTIALAKSLGAGRIIATDINPWRLELAKRFGADEVLDAREDLPAKISTINDGRLAEFIAVNAGAPSAAEQALKCADKGGRILLFAPTKPGAQISVPLFDLWNNGTTLTSSYGAAGEDIIESLQLIRSKHVPVQEMITHRLSLEKAREGFDLVAQAGQSLKVILEPHS